MSKYIIGDCPNRRHYDDIYDFMSSFDISLEEGDWCYLVLLTGTNELPKDLPVSDFLQEVCSDVEVQSDWQMLQFSVTSKEDRHQEWLDAVRGVPGHSITSAAALAGHTVYLCSFPIKPSLDNVEV